VSALRYQKRWRGLSRQARASALSADALCWRDLPASTMWAISVLLLLVETSGALRLPPTLLDISRQHASAVACAALLASSQPVMPAFAISCQLDCFKECNKVSRRGQRAAALPHSALEQQPLAVPELRTRVH